MDAYLEEEEKATKAFLKTSTKKAYSKIIKTTYSEEIIFKNIPPNFWINLGQSFRIGIKDFGEYMDFPIECLRRVDDNHYYVLYQTEEGGLLYVFFDSYYRYNSTAYMKKSLSHSDFSGIQIGSSAEEVNRIDPIVNDNLQYGQVLYDNTITSFHILKDGLLYIVFEKDGDGYQVKTIDFYDTFTMANSMISVFSRRIIFHNIGSLNLPTTAIFCQSTSRNS